MHPAKVHPEKAPQSALRTFLDFAPRVGVPRSRMFDRADVGDGLYRIRTNSL